MNSERLLQRIRLGEDSTLELKQVKVGAGGNLHHDERLMTGRCALYDRRHS